MLVGRAVWNKKTKTCEAWALDMTYLAKRVNFELDKYTYVSWKSNWGRHAIIEIADICPARITLKYTIQKSNGQSTPYSYNVILDTTPCNYGGKRWWFRCLYCHRRVRVIYLPDDSPVFACRTCHHLTYESQQVGKPRWVALADSVFKLPKLEEQWYRARSEKRRQKLERMMNRLRPGIQAIIDWGERTRRRRNRKR